MPAMTPTKLHWITEHINGAFLLSESGIVDCLSKEDRERFKIIASDNVSDHPYNPTALRIIAETDAFGGMVLDCGAGSRTFTAENLIQAEIAAYPNVDVLAVNQSLPFKDECFDAVISMDVLEHVTDPFAAAREISRVLKPGGVLYIDLPFLQHEHGYPHHFFNATRMGLRQLFEGLLEVQKHIVPNAGHPVNTLRDTVHTFLAGLPKNRRDEFRAMTVGEIIDADLKEFRTAGLGSLINDEVIWKMAHTTQAVMAKPGADVRFVW
jgi:SAM-dependent methyltransferase